ncbi:MAG: ribosome silencing factor [Defluviitaleaceae bacterium]|nr:ribosome silencing factor [Defluviitaleaceae bacterium]
MKKTLDIKEALKVAYKALDDKFGNDIVVLNISEKSILTDYFIIADGTNASQIKAMADEVNEKLGKFGLRINQSEGRDNAEWILLDYGDIIIHIFDKANRDFYDIERIWSDAEKVELGK